MQLVLFGARGNIGSQIAAEALSRGHDVTAVIRDAAQSAQLDQRLRVEVGDVTDAARVAELAQTADAVVSAVGDTRNPASSAAPAPLFARAARSLLDGVRRVGTPRLVVVGGAGSLETAPGVQVIDSPHFPEMYRADALGQRDALATYRSAESEGVDWTYVSPAAMIGAGDRTGHYRVGEDVLLVDENGSSFISYQDYAAAILDIIERRAYLRQRITVAY